MAPFNPNVPNAQEPNYLNYSRAISQPEPNKVAATAISGAANVIDLGIKSADYLIKEDIKNKAYSQIDPIRKDYANSLEMEKLRIGAVGGVGESPAEEIVSAENPSDAYAQASPEDAAEALSLIPKDDADAGTVPSAIDTGIRRAANLQSAFDGGKISHTKYISDLDQVAVGLRNRYPGYREYIDQQISRITGINPANAKISALALDLNRAYAAMNSDKTKSLTLLFKHRDEPDAPQMYKDYLATGDATKVYTWAANAEFRKGRLEKEKAERDAARDKRQEDAELTKNQATRLANEIITSQWESLRIGEGAYSPKQLFDKAVAELQGGPKLTPNEKLQFGQAMSSMEATAPILLRKNFREQGYNLDPAVEQNIINNTTRVFTEARQLIAKERYYSANAVTDAVKAASDTATQVMFGNNELAAYISILSAAQNLGPQAAEAMIQQTITMLPGAKVGVRETMDYFKLQSIMGPNYLMGEVPKADFSSAIDTFKNNKIQDPKTYAEVVNHSRVIKDKTGRFTDDHKASVIDFYFNPNNLRVLTKFDQKDRTDAFATLGEAGITDEVFRLGKLYPGAKLTQKYVAWADNSWNILFRDTLRTLADATADPNLEVSWSPETQTWDVRMGNIKPIGETGLMIGQRASPAFMTQRSENLEVARKAIRDMNTANSVMGNIARASGLKDNDVAKYVAAKMVQAGFDPTKAPQNFLDLLGKTVTDSLSPPQSTQGSNKRTSDAPRANTGPSSEVPTWQSIPHFADPTPVRNRTTLGGWLQNPDGQPVRRPVETDVRTLGLEYGPIEYTDKMGRVIRTEDNQGNIIRPK